MRVLEPVGLDDVLAAWALHECRGRLRAQLPAEFLRALDGPDGAFLALTLLQNRVNVLAAILAAGPVGCVRVALDRADVPDVRVMWARTLEEWSTAVRGVQDASGAHVRGLAAGPAPIEGPILAIARRAEGPLTILDGMHRAAAWVAHGAAGREYPLEVNVVVTRTTAPRFELPDRT